MNNLEQFSIISEMDQDKEYIDNYVLESDQGTKRMKEKFYETAVFERNQWVNGKIDSYIAIQNGLRDEIARRVPLMMPNDLTAEYDEKGIIVDKLLKTVILSSNCSNAFKLELSLILSGINELASLEDTNQRIRSFIDKFKDFGINLTIEDFKYTMFTEMYMNTFFENNDYDAVKDTFEGIYYKCPGIKLQLKMNLEHLCEKYDKQLSIYVDVLKNKMFQEFAIAPGGDVVAKYVNERFELGDRIATDEYYNFKLFLDGNKKINDYLEGSLTRNKIYDTFTLTGSYADYSDEDKKLFNESMMDLYLTLNELKKFYHYESILKELVGYYKEKTTAKNSYVAKKKEIEKEEKKREAIYKQYLKACGVGFLAKKSEDKQELAMLQMNNHINHLKELYDELNDLEIKYQVSLLADSSSIYDLFLASLTSFSFLEKSFLTEEYQEVSLEENVSEYLRFIFNPNNDFLRKVNGLNDYNLTDIVAEKYKLLKINVTSEMIQAESIDSTFQDVQFINLIQNIERSKMSLNTMDILYEMVNIVKTENNEE